MQHFITPVSKTVVATTLFGLLLTACNSSDSLPGSTSEKPIIADQPVTTGVPEKKLISGKGGTRIAILVNNEAITNTDIRRRAAFVRLRRLKGNPTAVARKELIEEAIKMQEARRLNAVASEREVNAAYSRFAQRNKMPQKVLDQILAQRGVTRRGFKQFIRTQMSWSRAVAARARSEGASTEAGPNNYQRWLPAVGQQSREVREFTLQQVVFTVPRSERSKQLAVKTAAARRFRNQVDGCKTTRDLAKNLKNVAVLDRGRIRADKLPPDWRKEVEKTAAGKATKVRQTPKGAEMLVVCRSRNVKTADANPELFSGTGNQEQVSAIEKKYFGELEKKAIVKQR